MTNISEHSACHNLCSKQIFVAADNALFLGTLAAIFAL